jgi:signal transduction histidine kinase
MLVLTEVASAAVVVMMAIAALARLAGERDYMDRYVFAPLLDIGQAQAARDELDATIERPPHVFTEESRAALLRLRSFVDRYRQEWETGTSLRPEAVRLRAELERSGESQLLDKEHELVETVLASVRRLERAAGLADPTANSLPTEGAQATELAALDTALTRLNLLNQRYVQIGYIAFERTHRQVTALFIAVSVLGIAAATWFGLSIRQAIAPRVARMAEAVDRFRQMGTFDPKPDDGDDDLAQLDRTLRLSFRAMADRDQERDRFLAVAAHELKTPLATLKGYAQVAAAHADDPPVRDRALAAIDRQSIRLARLVQDLLWSVRARASRLPFHPGPVDLPALVRQVLAEVRAACEGRPFNLTALGDAHVLADAGLLEQSLWTLFLEGATLGREDAPVEVTIDGDNTRTRLSVETQLRPELCDDVERLVEPFGADPYEGRPLETRASGLGLYLVREIARMHGALFLLDRRPGCRVALILELRR